MNWKEEWKNLAGITVVFLVFFWLPVENTRLQGALTESLALVRWYAREHVVLCLVPAFFIAGAIAVFVSHASVMKYLGARARKLVAYGVASISGSVLAVCSCTVLPLFAGIYSRGAGLGPATTFLYAGPAINVLAIILTARVLGLELGIARAVGAVLFSILVGSLMHWIFRREEQTRVNSAPEMPGAEAARPLWQTGFFFAALIAILVFANWGEPHSETGLWSIVFAAKWKITGLVAVALGLILRFWFAVRLTDLVVVAAPTIALALLFPDRPMAVFAAGAVGLSVILQRNTDETRGWLDSSWGFAKQILPLLFAGVLVAGALLGRPEHEGLIPSFWIERLVGGNSVQSNLFASVVGAFMYFATLTEVPILQGLIGAGMGKGPALALLLAGPALSLPNMLVIRSVLGTRKTVVYVLLVVCAATATGLLFGSLVG